MTKLGNPSVRPRSRFGYTSHRGPSIALILAVFVAALASASTLRQAPVAFSKAVGSAGSSTANPTVAPDLAQRVSRFRRVKMSFHSQGLTSRERQMIDKLVDAAGLLDCIYWRQSDPEGRKLYLSLGGSKNPQDEVLRRYLKINGSRFDLIDDEKPFVGTQPMPPGRGFFPEDMTRARFDGYVAAHPAQKAALYNPQTIVGWKGGTLEAIPYHVAYREFLEPMAKDLREAAALSEDPAFAKFLRLRADALFTDDYFASDIAWLDLQNPKFDIIFAPYETYLDSLLGVKTSYGASVMIRNDQESKKLAVFQKYVPDLQESLPLSRSDLPSKRGKQSPMEVVDSPYRAGDLLHGYQAVADNLPNDPRIHEQKGSKKMFWKNFMDARVNYIILPLAKRVMKPDQAALASGDGYLTDTLMHEISHGLGPAFAHTAARKTDIREAIGPQYSGLEEAKADVVGEFGLKWLIDHGEFPKEKQNAVYASYVAGIFRTVRFGIAEAHGAAEMMEFNYLTEQGAIRRDPGSALYEIRFDRMPGAIGSLAKELLEQEATGDRARTERWFKKYAVMPAELSAALAKASDIPVDVDPEFDFHPPLR
ncbi:MAG: Zn-dependent hydrolase [Candidatus Acidiferrales bacterium]